MIGGIITLILSLGGAAAGVTAAGGSVFAAFFALSKAWKIWGLIITITLVDWLLNQAFAGALFVSYVLPEIPPDIGCAFVTLDAQPAMAAIASAYTFRVLRILFLPIIQKL